jgi:hypothetical protein
VEQRSASPLSKEVYMLCSGEPLHMTHA